MYLQRNASQKLKPEAMYRVQLCTINSEEILESGDVYGDYYISSHGVFYPRPNFAKIQEIIVKKSPRKNRVIEVASGLEFPLVLLNVTKNMKEPEKYECHVLGDHAQSVVAFGVMHENINTTGDEEYWLEEVQDDITVYLRANKDENKLAKLKRYHLKWQIDKENYLRESRNQLPNLLIRKRLKK